MELDRVAGCLLGGALGDALGHPIEFEKTTQLDRIYSFSHISGRLLVSDDTQMTLFTANALLLAGDLLTNTWACYQDWLETQFKHDRSELSPPPVSWLLDYPEMYASREPGRTYLLELMRGIPGNLAKPLNQSKGCGALMRVAPLTFIKWDDPSLVALENSALTHGHWSSHIASAALVVLLRYILEGENLASSVTLMRKDMKRYFVDRPEFKGFDELLEQAVVESSKATNDSEVITRLGEGFVAEETLAIALYCALKY